MSQSARPAGPVGGQVACSGCGATLDSLRAGHAAIFQSQLHFFCDRRRCRARFLGVAEEELPAPLVELDEERSQRQPELDAQPVRVAAVTVAGQPMPEPLRIDESHEMIEPLGEGSVAASPVYELAPDDERGDVGLLLEALALIAGSLAMALEMAAPSKLVLVARLVLLGLGVASLSGRILTSEADAARPHRFVWLAAPCLALLTALYAILLEPLQNAQRPIFLAATVVTASAANAWLVGYAWRPVQAARRWVRRRLAVAARRLTDEAQRAPELESSDGVEVGERLIVEAGETIGVDMLVEHGEADVLPWLGALTSVRRKPGETVVAGGQVVSGQLRGVCTHSGDDRAMARSLFVDEQRPDAHAQVARWPRLLAERWAVLVALLAAVAALLGGWSWLDTTMVLVAAYAAIANGAVGGVAALAVARGLHSALGRGIVYISAAAWEQCSEASTAVFCARGTLLRGEPELVEIEATTVARGLGTDDNEVLALAAGTLGGANHPTAVAVRRAAKVKGVLPEAVRDARSHDGLGMTGVAATGEPLCVGTRALMMDRRISIAAAEQRVYQLEGMGRTVVLVGKGGRLVGILALQDGLRAGARAAVQHLLDAGVEPVLMSADTRETCEALGRALDIEHLRAELPASEQPEAIERIRSMGGRVAVVGHTPHDDDALVAADASVAMLAAGGERQDFAAALVNDDVRDAALALAMARGTRGQAQTASLLALAPAAFGVVVVALGWLPPEYAPIAQLLGAVAAVWHVRGDARRQPQTR